MTPELREKLENLVFSVPSPYLSLDARLQLHLDLIAECERETIERCAQVAEVQAGGHYMARICAVAIRAEQRALA